MIHQSDSYFRALQLKAKSQVHTLLSGNNFSNIHGEGYDFSELREYRVGDDIRKINWTITAKMGKPYVKEFHANRELSVGVIALLTPSLYFGFKDNKRLKLNTLTNIAMVLGYATLYNSDLFRGVSYCDESAYVTPPTKQLYTLNQFLKNIYDAPLLGTHLDYRQLSKDIFTKFHRPSLLFILSDFLEEIDISLLAQKHEVVVIFVRHRDEENPKRLGEVTLQDPSSMRQLDTFFGIKSLQSYSARLKESDRRLKEHFSSYGIRYITIYTDEEIVSKLIRLF